MRFGPIAAHHHLELAVWPEEVLQQDAVNVDGPVVILEDADTLALRDEPARVLFDKGRFTGT